MADLAMMFGAPKGAPDDKAQLAMEQRRSAAEDAMRALRKDDIDAFEAALTAFFTAVESLPHEEGGER